MVPKAYAGEKTAVSVNGFVLYMHLWKSESTSMKN
jgi:hypothetical protein